MSETCVNCKFAKVFWVAGYKAPGARIPHHQDKIECRVRSKQIVFTDIVVESHWPLVEAGDWCGEYQAREPAQ